jgi:hypothetical protein
MTRKDFQLIADVMAGLSADWKTSWTDTVSLSLVAEELADALATTNERFNRETFLTACGVK